MQRIEDFCGDTFPDISKEKGIQVWLYKKTPQSSRYGYLKEGNPLEISLYLSKADNANIAKEVLIRLLVRSFIGQQYEYRFRNHVQTLFEDILSDEYVTSVVTFMVMGRKLGRANCVRALEQAVEETVFRLSQKQTQNKLADLMYNFFQEEKIKTKKKSNIIEQREELVLKLLDFLPEKIKTQLQQTDLSSTTTV
ncbi:MAG: hypothetical protein FWD52_02315 [Candidatus Bathyarchaeota archaeon]|nr:hypothetical protein [Candidatus Termiticorpusculum sp.]